MVVLQLRVPLRRKLPPNYRLQNPGYIGGGGPFVSDEQGYNVGMN